MDPPRQFADLRSRLTALAGTALDDQQVIEESTAIAHALLSVALDARRLGERLQAEQLARLVHDEAGKRFTNALCDRAFRSEDPQLVAHTWRRLLQRCGRPRSPAWWQRLGLSLGALATRLWAWPPVAALDHGLRRETRRVILPAEDGPLSRHLARRRREGMRENLNQLGEAVLGEREAAARLQQYRSLIARSDVAYVSVKLSALCSQLDVLAYDEAVDILVDRLHLLFRDALHHRYCDADGREHPKWINLDMEEYRDLAMTVAAFTRALDAPDCQQARGGIAIQGYLPDSWPVLQELTQWARARVDGGGAQPKVRLVKGANLAMEIVEAGQHGWQPAPYPDKPSVDANYKRLLDHALQADHARGLRVGVASHNLFDVAYALVRRAQHGSEADVEFEMLEGMADHQARTLGEVVGDLLLYAPVVERSEVRSAIAYLVRRLDENTAPGNFLSSSFAMRPGDEAWHDQRRRFEAAVHDRHRVTAASRRDQDRHAEERAQPAIDPTRAFRNVADTDWTLAGNRDWIAGHLQREARREVDELPVVIRGTQHGADAHAMVEGIDPAAPDRAAYRHAVIEDADVDRALDSAVAACVGPGERRGLLLSCAAELARRRGELIAAGVRDGGKSVREMDIEVSEAIDFAAWYARGLDEAAWHDGCRATALGAVVVAPPWNFPISIPLGGLLAGLAAGNGVILKPAPEAVWCGWVLCQALWAAGVPREACQFAPSRDDAVGKRLISDQRVAAVVLTGASATARRFLEWRRDLRLFAETGGKNALIITPHADREQAAQHLVQSAFGHAGQKCSAASIGILVGEVAEDPSFKRALIDAAESLAVGPGWDHRNRVQPLIRAPGPELQQALEASDGAGEWWLAPRRQEGAAHLWSPGIRAGVQPGDWLHSTECFGPVLALVRAGALDDAIDIANSTPYGLTGGLHSLDEDEQHHYLEHIQVGNAYINRTITGAVVARQPFGGWKDSSFGPGAKAGGPDYVAQFAHWQDDGLPQRQAKPHPRVEDLLRRCERLRVTAATRERWRAAAGSDAWHWRQWFALSHELAPVPGEANRLRYRPAGPVGSVWLRLGPDDRPGDAVRFALGAACCSMTAVISVTHHHAELLAPLVAWPQVACHVDDDAAFLQRLTRERPLRLRAPSHPGEAALAALHAIGGDWLRGPLLLNGRHELRTWLREQSCSVRYHRYGNEGLGPPRI